ncbi:CCR4-NOT transcription complex subunit 7-like [Haemaphysalis longicornis]
MFGSSFERCFPIGNDINSGPRVPAEPSAFREVRASIKDEELDTLMHLLQKYNHVAVDTEFPGVLVRPANKLQPSHFQHSLVRGNVNMLKHIQLGFSFLDKNREPAPYSYTSSHHHHLDVTTEGTWAMSASPSITPPALDKITKPRCDVFTPDETGRGDEAVSPALLVAGVPLRHYL